MIYKYWAIFVIRNENDLEELFSAEEQPDETAEILQKGDEKQHLNKRKPQSAQITRWKPLQVSFPVSNCSPSLFFPGIC